MWDNLDWILHEHFDRVFFSLITVIIVCAAILDIRDKNHPPGPTGIPFFGYLPLLNRETPYKQLMSLTQQYGRVFGVQLGSIYAVVVADVKLIKKAYTTDEFQSSPLYLANGFNQEQGICSKNGDMWKEHRNFVFSLLKNIGQGSSLSKTMIENQLQQSIREFLQDIKGNLGDEQDIIPSLRSSVGLMLMGIIMGTQYDRDHSDWKVLQSVSENESQVATVTGILNYIPLLRRVAGFTETMRNLFSGRKKSEKIYKEILEKQSKSLNSSNVPQCVLDAYLVEVKKRGTNVGTFTNDQIQQALLELVSGGWETSLATLKWLYLYMAMYPEVQEKIAQEVAGVVGEKSEVGVDDLDKLQYTEATILEIWRHQTITPLGAPHTTKEKTKLDDYIIPENSMIIPLLWAVHHDSRLWENQESFCPERFLYEDGCIFRNENLLPFQTGNRMCIGEELQRWTIKLFLANTVNQFQIQFPKGYTYNNVEAPKFGKTLVPRPYPLVLQSRLK